MRASPTCPGLTPGRPFLQLDHARACWATETLSAAGLRAWLRLLTHFRNDRPIPRLSERRLAEITGLSAGAAHKVLTELREVLVFAGQGEEVEDEPETLPHSLAELVAEGCSRNERGAHEMSTGRSRREQKRSQREQRCSRNEHSSFSFKEEIQEGKNPPPHPPPRKPARGCCPEVDAEEDEGLSGSGVRGGAANSRSGGQALTAPAADLGIDPRLAEVAPELGAYWSGKRGSRTALAFAAQQAQLLQIAASPIGGIEAVREQLQTAAMKDWDFIRYRTWHEWRTAHPEPLALTEADLTEGGLFPGLKAFERRYRATYGQNSSPAQVLIAFHNYRARLEHERSLRDITNA